ncbi:helix-turn-helix domain-containing protein [Niallia sp. 01092]|uniref:helix-turn-helix domain-containing protein n=1 Tax=unclassified Niallia TaxID=2837522 RepID=UPI003FD1EE0C
MLKKDAYLNCLGRYLRGKRMEMNLTITQLGEITDLDFNHLGKIERGVKYPNGYTLLILCEALNIESFSELQAELHNIQAQKAINSTTNMCLKRTQTRRQRKD